MFVNCESSIGLRSLVLTVACCLSAVRPAFADASANRLEHLHHATISVAHAMSTAQLLGHALAKRAIGRSENQFQRDLNNCESLGGINFGEARWRLQAVDAGARLEELANAEKLFGILLEAARQWNGTAEDAFDVMEAIGVLNYQLERLSVGIGRMSDDELAALLQHGASAASQPSTSASAVSSNPKDILESSPSRSRNMAWRLDDQNP